MTTILPEKNKKEIKNRYIFGFIAKTFQVLTVVLIIWLVFEGTLYHVAGLENQSAIEDKGSKEFADRNNLIHSYKEALSDSKKLVKVFEEDQESKTQIFNYIFGLIPEGVYLNNLSVQEEGEGLNISISGFADNREALSSLNNVLNNQKQISGINIPSSLFTKTFDINFSLSFKYEYANE